MPRFTSKRFTKIAAMSRLSAPLLCLALPLIGCGGNISAPAVVTIPNETGNWQIQTTNAAPSIGVILLGTMTVQGDNATGTFRFADLAQGSACGSTFQTLSFTGTIAPKTGELTLLSQAFGQGGSTFQAYLGLSPTAHFPNDGDIVITGTDCVYPSSPAVGIQIAPVTGTYTGTVTIPGSLPNSGQATASLNLTQAADPNPDGQYAVTGPAVFTGPGCTETVNVSGTVSGESLNLASVASASGTSDITIAAATNPTATDFTDASFTIAGGPCFSTQSAYNTYVGTLALNAK